MKQLVVGVLAHVDAGKTTLSEAMLYTSGMIRKLGRVDHQNAFLDTDAIEKERGITIFSKQAVLDFDDTRFFLLDTPGHVDFSTETERTLRVLDYAVLVISGTDGVQGHTKTLWRLLRAYHVPTFLFVNKMDLSVRPRDAIMKELRTLDGGCVDFCAEEDSLFEEIALCDEQVMADYLSDGTISDTQIGALIQAEKLFPCYFGAALKNEGVSEFLDAMARYMCSPVYPQEFGARVYKIARDTQGARLTYLKVTGGSLKVKDLLRGSNRTGDWEEKVDQIRIYSGIKYQTAEEVPAGVVCAVTGLSKTQAGDGLGFEPSFDAAQIEPVLSYRVKIEDGTDPFTALQKLKQLEEEDPQLHMTWNERLKEIYVQPMGEVQLEVLTRVIFERFSLSVTFDEGNIVYKETVKALVCGAGHFEPLRHYAEVHVLIEPMERGSGVSFDTVCSEDDLDRNWQRLILTHLAERTHPGVLIGAPLTDVKITLIAGRAHLKHTEGGDFRQATYRAVRQALKKAENVLLEPYYAFRIEVPAAQVGRAISDLQRMNGTFSPPETEGELAILTGTVPVKTMRSYQTEFAAYTKGQGRLSTWVDGYRECHNPQEVIEQSGYDSDRDTENPADSVFCSHGAGVVVKWDEADRHMHLSPEWGLKQTSAVSLPLSVPSKPVRREYASTKEEDKALRSIYEQTYGPIKQRGGFVQTRSTPLSTEEYGRLFEEPQQAYLLVDGYNVIFAWDELREAAKQSAEAARNLLIDILSNYQPLRGEQIIIVFDAYKVPRANAEIYRYPNLYVVFTKEAQTADSYIEQTTYEIGKHHRVRVVTSDGLEQLIILGHGASRVSAQMFKQELEHATRRLSEWIEENNRHANEKKQLRYTAKITLSAKK